MTGDISELNLREFTRLAGTLLQPRCPYAAWIPNAALLIVGLTWCDRHDWMMGDMQNIQAVLTVLFTVFLHASSATCVLFQVHFLCCSWFPTCLITCPALMCFTCVPLSFLPLRSSSCVSPTVHLLLPPCLTFTVSAPLLSFDLQPKLQWFVCLLMTNGLVIFLVSWQLMCVFILFLCVCSICLVSFGLWDTKCRRKLDQHWKWEK